MRIIVADNDDHPTAETIVAAVGAESPVPVDYIHAPARNISLARNAAFDAAGSADWVAFLDDDEVASADWLCQLLATARKLEADAVFGPSVADYGPGAPQWIRRHNYHSNIPRQNFGQVMTGHTCNALLRWAGTPWHDLRFELARGRSGGEDTAFFFEIWRRGGRLAICDDAVVREAVPEQRLSFRWLARRRFRSGQSFASLPETGVRRATLVGSAGAKIAVCALATAGTAWSRERRNYWLLRGSFHLGVIAGCLRMTEPELYGGEGTET